MKIGIVGCGFNSDYHINFAKDYPGAEIIGLVDKDEEKVRQCAAKYSIKNVYASIKELVDEHTPDAIHVITPPQTHYPLVKEVLELKCHVLVEKPMAIHAQEARELFDLAEAHGVKLCTMHNHFFDPCMLKARKLFDDGKTGKIVYVESYYGLNTQIPQIMSYPDVNIISWMFELPGGLFHDFLAHPLYVLLEYTGSPLKIDAIARSNGTLFQNLPDELHVMIEGQKAMGKLTLSFTAKPFGHFLNLYGTKMFVSVDFNNMVTKAIRVSKLPNAATKLTFNLSLASQLTKQTISNLFKFVTGKLKPYHGMRTLIHNFYDSILYSKEIPVSQEQALSVIKVMDEIWEKIGNVNPSFENILPSVRKDKKLKGTVLVTGACGFLGKRLAERLVGAGYQLRVLVRKLARVELFKELNAETYYGDVRDTATLKEAIKGTDYIIHAAATSEGDIKCFEDTNIKGTENVFTLASQEGVMRIVYISSMAVYQISGLQNGTVISEDGAFEARPKERGYYSYSKMESERWVQEFISRNEMPTVILRPATIFGPGGPIMTPLIGISAFNKLFVTLGKESMRLPLVYIDNLIDAILLSMDKEDIKGEVFNIIDDEGITKKDYINDYVRRIFPKSWSLFLPWWFVYLSVFTQEILFRSIGKTPVLTRYRLTSASNEVIYDNTKVKTKLAWTPKISLQEGLDRTFNWL